MGAIGPGGSATATIRVSVSLRIRGAVINTVAVTGNEADPDTTNNTATQTTLVVDPPAVPGLSAWGTVALAVALARLGFMGLSRRRKGLTQASSP